MSEDLMARAKDAANIDYAPNISYDDWQALARGLITEVKRLQDLIDKPPEEADWNADYHLLQAALDGPIIEAARKWHRAYRKAQNSNLIRRQQTEGLAARIKELEAYVARLEAAFLESEAYAHACMGESMPIDEEDRQAARDALEEIRAGRNA